MHAKGLVVQLRGECLRRADAVVAWLDGDSDAGAASLRRGAESLEAIPLTYEAARLRRQLAGRLAEIGDREGALRELRHVHRIFEGLGAKGELQKTLEMFIEVGTPLADDETAAPPPREAEIKKLLEAAPRYGVEIKVPHDS